MKNLPVRSTVHAEVFELQQQHPGLLQKCIAAKHLALMATVGLCPQELRWTWREWAAIHRFKSSD